ncbi:hypothetical protein [Streptomyces melanogenes]|uniref:hypothetical protein n=1 Tax=Streptomyces melanogenes TaxID=67326 RepID=UPI0037BD7E07
MPLALLLQQTLGTFKGGASALRLWTEIVALEGTVVERARGAFLAHWFGPRLPLHGGSVRASIGNLGELAARVREVRKGTGPSAAGPSLAEPLAGFAGTLAGMLLSPAGVVFGTVELLRFAGFSQWVLALALLAVPAALTAGLIAAPLDTLVVSGRLLVGGGVLAALLTGLGDTGTVEVTLGLFTSLAGLMNASVLLLSQLAAPTSKVRNPLLAGVRDLAPRLAAVLGQALGALSVVVIRIGPLLRPVAATLRAMVRFAAAGGAALALMADGARGWVDEQRDAWPTVIGKVFARVLSGAGHRMGHAGEVMSGQLAVVADVFRTLANRLPVAWGTYTRQLRGFSAGVFTEHPVGQAFGSFHAQIKTMVNAFRTAPAAPPSRPSAVSERVAVLKAALPSLPQVPPIPSLPDLLDSDLIRMRLGGAGAAPVDLAAIENAAKDFEKAVGTGAAVALGRRVRDVLSLPAMVAPERSALARDRDRLAARSDPPGLLLQLSAAQLVEFRRMLGLIVGRVLPPELRHLTVPGLVDPETLPVREVPATEELRPVVSTLRVRAPGGASGDVRRFADLVAARIRHQRYPANAPASSGGR